eukprot:NODE_3404_length_1225_cov_125.700544_g3230_i0.p1 GENE.NODE_3404_length_1225_cov_125.700544_g3230_i0~~NODE_3404_length_1225_cov_125.700544_g3230_i0.p1  ORF type:complete len:372 (+),score=64.20 NODE_3404_length_1225_cov_125.700544_g3230_i0:59-1117(+)
MTKTRSKRKATAAKGKKGAEFAKPTPEPRYKPVKEDPVEDTIDPEVDGFQPRVKNPTGDMRNARMRHQVYQKVKKEKRVRKDTARAQRIKIRKELGDKAPAKLVPHTLESLRTPDTTIVIEGDEEIKAEEDEDEWSKYFQGNADPKILITTCNFPSKRTKTFVQELRKTWPHAEYWQRRGYELKKITEYAIKREYTDIIVIGEQNKVPAMMIVSHLPKGPTATFRISNFVTHKELPDSGVRSKHPPELNLKNFDTRLGRRMSRMFHALFKSKPDNSGRAIATFHNQRDFVFFRMHRYIFDSLSKVRIQELGPRFTLRLRGLQHGLFDTRFGEWEWAYHKKEMGGKDRRMFNL